MTGSKIQKKHKQGRRLTGILAVAVIFVMSCALALPAAATEGEAVPQEPAAEAVQPAAPEPAPEPAAEPSAVTEEPAPEEPAPQEPVPEEPASQEPAPEEPAPQEPVPSEPEEPVVEPVEEPAEPEEPAAGEDPGTPASDDADPAAPDPADGNGADSANQKEDNQKTDEDIEDEKEDKEKKPFAGTLYYGCDAYTASVSFDEKAEIPEGAGVAVQECTAGSPEYPACYESVKRKLEEDGIGGEDPENAIASLQLYKVLFTDEDGREITPKASVSIEIEYKNDTNTVTDGKQYALTFRTDEGQPEKAVLTEKNADGSDTVVAENNVLKKLRVLSFAMHDSHIRPVIGRLSLAEEEAEEETEPAETDGIKTVVVAVEDAGYSLNIEYGPEAGIPDDAVFYAVPVPEDHDEYEEYRDRALSVVDEKEERRTTLLGLFDLTIRDAEDNVIEPLVPITVRADLGSALNDVEDVYAVHFAETSAEDAEKAVPAADADLEVIPAENKDGAAAFEAAEFSVFAVVGTTIEKTITAGDGASYRISVTYGKDTGIPEEAGLSVEEITPEDEDSGTDTDAAAGTVAYGEYVSMTERALGWEEGTVSYIRLFDIKIVDGSGEKVDISAPVDVKIELADTKDSRDLNVVHFADGAQTGDVVGSVAADKTETFEDGFAVSFSAEGFSAYAIVDRPESASIDWVKAETIGELTNPEGFYIGHVSGYYFTNTLNTENNRTGITKTQPAQDAPPIHEAVLYYFEPAGGENKFYAYCFDNNGVKQYVRNQNNNSLTFTTNSNDKTAFTVEVQDGIFRIHNGNWYWNMQGGANGKRFCSYNVAGDVNNNLYIWYPPDVKEDPYGLDGKSYGLMNWNGGAAGKAVMAGTTDTTPQGSLDAKALTVMTNKDNDEDKLFVPKNSDISMWTFHWDNMDSYRITTVADGSTKYLKIAENGQISLVSEETEASLIQVIPGTGVHAGEICLKSGNKTLTYSGTLENGFNTSGSVGSEWLHLVNESELTEDYFVPRSARKVSVSDYTEVGNGARLIVYTRAWNEEKKRYDLYAIDHNGSLVPCYESGNHIEWVDDQINSLLWDFTEYTEEGVPTGFYELYNEYSEKFIAPQVTGGQILSDETIGINLTGREAGRYYTTILAWDDENYAYAGYKVENGQIVSCPKPEAMDFYFAILEDVPVDDKLNTVPTIDNTQYGITMKIKNFNTGSEMSSFLGNNEGGMGTVLHQGLLSTNLGDDGYPTVKTGTPQEASLGDLYSGENEVNHLFIESIYKATGYYEFDSAQNFASLEGKTGGDFTVYKELATYDSAGSRETLKHGQFFPFNQIEPGVYASVNGKNLYGTILNPATNKPYPLDTDDPRKNEKLYLIKNIDCYFGVELEASFVQTPDGHDAWGHDIIYEFTGDDDFWLYVDGELVIDLGGIHSAVAGSVNFCTGEVVVNGNQTTLKNIFIENYTNRYKKEHEGASPTQEQIDAYLTEKNFGDGGIFEENTTHTMRIFYMERGAGASNLHMRFNLASVRPGTVQLSKELSGVDAEETVLAEFPYQIQYKYKNEEGTIQEAFLTNLPKSYVFYKDTTTPVTYKDRVVIAGVEYQNVFMLKPGEIAEIEFPKFGEEKTGIEEYRIIECCVNTEVYDDVYVNNRQIPVTGEDVKTAGGQTVEGRKDYSIEYKTTDERAKVIYDNDVNPAALRTLTIQKKLYDEYGTEELHNVPATFNFRLYLATEFDGAVYETPANMHTYHVKDENGDYCKWDASIVEEQKFVSIGKSSYEELTKDEIAEVSFHTSMNGSISKIPAFYTVEVRNVLAGTQYRVEERPNEIPDGYSFQRYDLDNEYVPEKIKPNPNAGNAPGVEDMIVTGWNPEVDVSNLKGWGLRMNKVWTDQDYMSGRDTAYFAVFLVNGQEPALVPGTVRKLEYSTRAEDQTLYWYFDHLVSDTTLGQYEIREVTITGNEPTVNENGEVTDYGTVTPVGEGGRITLHGTQKGETEDSQFTYKVLYTKGEIPEDANVRVDRVENDRPGIVLKKTEWDGKKPLAGAKFTLKRGNEVIGTFTSDENGSITTAFLSDNVDYTLTEILTPNGYHGLEAPMTIRQIPGQDGTAAVTVSGVAEEYYKLVQAKPGTEDEETEPASLTIKNHSYSFRAVKKDSQTEETLEGVTFALHRQVTVEGVTVFDKNPMPGYEELVTDSEGVIPKLDWTLPAGVYQLREMNAPEGYEKLPYIYFTVSSTGTITLDMPRPDGVDLDEQTTEAGTMEYTLTIFNTKQKNVSFMKVDIDHPEKPLKDARFDLYAVKDGSRQIPALYTGLTSGTDGILRTPGSSPQSVFTLPVGVYHLVETEAPAGYNLKADPVVITITGQTDTGDIAFNNGSAIQGVRYNDEIENSTEGRCKSYDAGSKTYTLKISDKTGTVLPHTGGRGTLPYTIGGLILILGSALAYGLVKRRRKIR